MLRLVFTELALFCMWKLVRSDKFLENDDDDNDDDDVCDGSQ